VQDAAEEDVLPVKRSRKGSAKAALALEDAAREDEEDLESTGVTPQVAGGRRRREDMSRDDTSIDKGVAVSSSSKRAKAAVRKGAPAVGGSTSGALPGLQVGPLGFKPRDSHAATAATMSRDTMSTVGTLLKSEAEKSAAEARMQERSFSDSVAMRDMTTVGALHACIMAMTSRLVDVQSRVTALSRAVTDDDSREEARDIAMDVAQIVQDALQAQTRAQAAQFVNPMYASGMGYPPMMPMAMGGPMMAGFGGGGGGAYPPPYASHMTSPRVTSSASSTAGSYSSGGRAGAGAGAYMGAGRGGR